MMNCKVKEKMTYKDVSLACHYCGANNYNSAEGENYLLLKTGSLPSAIQEFLLA